MRADEGFGQVVASHVFDDRTACANDPTVGQYDCGAQHKVTQRAVTYTQGRVDVGSNQSPDGCIRPGSCQRDLIASLSQEGLYFAQRRSRCYRNVQVVRRIHFDPVQFIGAQKACWRWFALLWPGVANANGMS